MNPGNPASGKSQPSFQTNVNRAKTKRWVEAKSYSYDGDDWGDDDYDEYDQSPPPPPVPPVARTTGLRKPSQGVASPTSSSGRLPSITRESTGQQDDTSRGRSPPVGSQSHSLQDIPNQSVSSLPAETSSNDGQASTNTSKPLPFIRPADIYKRMEEERAKERQGASVTDTDSNPAANRDPSAEKKSEDSAANTTSQLPEVQTGSSFGADFLSHSGETQEATTPSSAERGEGDPDQPDLHHNPSLGFRSVVHQAFDTPPNQGIPETPSSTTDSVMRSNSDGTSVISPIISSNPVKGSSEIRGPDEAKTPTIEEEPREPAAEVATPGDQTPSEFKPGHRRGFSPPSPGNSPARRPVLATNDHPVQSEQGDLSSIPSSASPAENSGTDAAEQQVTSTSPDRTSTPKPTITTSSMGPLRPLETRGGIAHHDHETPYDRSDNDDLPTMSTETSPQDTESDRLRKEIFRSLSPQRAVDHGETSTPSEPRSRIRQESTLIPSEYDSYWNDPSFHNTARDGDDASTGVITASPIDTSTKELPTIPDATTETPPAQPALRRNFSWEDVSQADLPPQEDVDREGRAQGTDRPQGTPGGPVAASDTAPLSNFGETDANTGSESPISAIKDSPEQGGLSLVSPNPEVRVSSESSDAGATGRPESAHQEDPTVDAGSYTSPQPAKPVQSASDPRVPGFREILLLKTPYERIHMFNDAREQFAASDPGLENWVRLTLQALPEHSDLVGQTGRLPPNSTSHKPTPSRNKFPKLPSSLANLSLQTSSNQDGSSPQTSTPTHGRNPSASGLGNVISGQQVQAKGKDFLHSAGVLSGKAGGAAKGLFAKSKSRFRGSGSDKVPPSSTVSGSYQALPQASGNTYRIQDGSAWPQRIHSLRQTQHSSSLSMGDITASLASIPASLDSSDGLSNIPSNTTDGNATSTDPSTGPRIPPTVDSSSVQSSQGVSSDQTTGGTENPTASWMPAAVGQNNHGQSTGTGVTSEAPPVLDVNIASPSIGEQIDFSQPKRVEDQDWSNDQSPDDSQEHHPSNVSTSYSGAIPRMMSRATGISDSSHETESIPDVKTPAPTAGTTTGTHQPSRNSGLPSYEASELRAQHAQQQQLQVLNPPSNHRRKFSFEDDDDEPPLENNQPQQLQHANNQTESTRAFPSDEKRGVGGYPAPQSPPAAAPPYSNQSNAAPYVAPGAPPTNGTFAPASNQEQTAYHPFNPGYGQHGHDPTLQYPQNQHPSYSAVNPQNNGYSVQPDPPAPPANYPYVHAPMEQGQPSSSMPVFPPYRTGSWVSTRPQHQTGAYPSTEVSGSPYSTTPGSSYPPHPQPHGGWSTTPQIQPLPADVRSGYLDANHTPGGSRRPGSFTNPDSDSQKSGESMMVNAAASRTDLAQQDKPASTSRKDGGISKIKKLNKLQRASTSRDVANPDSGVKKGFSRLSGLFGRSSTSASPRRSPFIPKLSSPSERPQQQRSQTFNAPSGHDSFSTSNRAQTFAGQAPPIGGYYAPDNPVDEEPDDEIVESPVLERSDTSTGNNYLSYQPSQSRPSQNPSPTYRISPTNPRGNERQTRWDSTRSHTQNLHMRSRSPRSHPPRPEEYEDPEDSQGDPAYNLGTFHSVVPATPRVGDQERPYPLTLPDDGRRSQDQRPLSFIPQKVNNRARLQKREHAQPPPGPPTQQFVTNRPAEDDPPPPPPKDTGNPPLVPFESKAHLRDASHARGPSLVVVPPTDGHREVTPARNVGGDAPVELPVSGDTSDDEIVMSSTAYPGQEWQPSNLGHWD